MKNTNQTLHTLWCNLLHDSNWKHPNLVVRKWACHCTWIDKKWSDLKSLLYLGRVLGVTLLLSFTWNGLLSLLNLFFISTSATVLKIASTVQYNLHCRTLQHQRNIQYIKIVLFLFCSLHKSTGSLHRHPAQSIGLSWSNVIKQIFIKAPRRSYKKAITPCDCQLGLCRKIRPTKPLSVHLQLGCSLLAFVPTLLL